MEHLRRELKPLPCILQHGDQGEMALDATREDRRDLSIFPLLPSLLSAPFFSLTSYHHHSVSTSPLECPIGFLVLR